MKITYRVAVPEPCSEDWEGMKPLGCGRFCAACEKTVVDFTTFSDEAFVAYFRKHTGNTCGRFTQDQLNLEIPWLDTEHIPRPAAKPLYKALSYAALSLLSLALPEGTASGQQTATTEQLAPSMMYPVKVTGTLLDEKGEPVPGGSVLLRGSREGTATDMDGHFEILLRDGLDTLEFRAIGLDTRLIKVENPGIPLLVRLVAVSGMMQEPVFISGPVLRKGEVSAGSAIVKCPVTDVIKAMPGTIPCSPVIRTGGVMSSAANIQIGGALYAFPLIIVNGKRFQDRVTDIDPQQVKAIKVLKDAAATALWGAAGRNGVLLIETKDASFWYRITKPFRRK